MPDWRQLCRGLDGISIEGDEIQVAVADGRPRRVAVHETADTIELTGIVARFATIDKIPDVPLRAWHRNRAMQLVGFRIDQKNRLIGETWLPKAGLDRDEFLFYLKRIAVECELFEYQLIGKDQE